MDRIPDRDNATVEIMANEIVSAPKPAMMPNLRVDQASSSK